MNGMLYAFASVGATCDGMKKMCPQVEIENKDEGMKVVKSLRIRKNIQMLVFIGIIFYLCLSSVEVHRNHLRLVGAHFPFAYFLNFGSNILSKLGQKRNINQSDERKKA